jgi:hypothetical protein
MCDSCQLVNINGIPCHEIGCPDAWKDEVRECNECGCDFTPQFKTQDFCDESCANSFYGYPPIDEDDFLED